MIQGLIKFLVSHEERVDNLAADFAAEGQKVVNKLKRKCEDDYNQFKFNLEDGRHRGRYIYQYVKKELNGIWGRGIPKAKKARFNI